ncbi:MAG: hypothetical protein WCI51_03805 [Lentisphaerota bacterium]
MITENELQRFEEQKDWLEKTIKKFKAIPSGGKFSYKPDALWLSPVPKGITPERFEEIKKIAWLKHTEGHIPYRFKLNGGRKLNPLMTEEIDQYCDDARIIKWWTPYSHDHLIYLRLLSELKDIGADEIVKKKVKQSNLQGKNSGETRLKKSEEISDTYCKFREKQEDQGFKARAINNQFYKNNPDCEKTSKTLTIWWNKYKTRT